jgi:ribosomal protein S27AE
MKRIVDVQPLIDKVVSCIRTDVPNPKISLGECLYHLQSLPVISDDRSSEKPVGEWLVRKSTTSSLFRECPYCGKKLYPMPGLWDTKFCPRCGVRLKEMSAKEFENG